MQPHASHPSTLSVVLKAVLYGLGCLALLVACQSQGEPLPFQTIDRGDRLLWEVREPGLLILSSPTAITEVEALVTAESLAKLRDVEFATHFVIAVFLGYQPNSHEGIEITRITRQGQHVTIEVDVGALDVEPVETSPRHIVTVEKEGTWGEEIAFNLLFNGERALTQSHFVP